MRDSVNFRTQCEAAIANGDVKALELAVGNFASFQFDRKEPNETFPDDIVDMFAQLIKTKRFLDMDESHTLLTLLIYDWGQLEEAQVLRLVPLLRDAFPLFCDWMACFVISELLGRHACSDASCEALVTLSKDETCLWRCLVPMGLAYVVRGSPSPVLRKVALQRLMEMSIDVNPAVALEAQSSLNRCRTEK